MISTCSQQICWRLPNGIQHCANTRAESKARAGANAQNDRAAGMLVHQRCESFADLLRIALFFHDHDQRHRAGAQHAGRLTLAEIDPQIAKILQQPFGLDGGFHLRMSSTRGRCARASHRRLSVPRCRRHNSENPSGARSR